MYSKLKSNQGITLTALIIYIIVIMIVLGIVVSIRTFFFNNMSLIQAGAEYAEAFDAFNTRFVEDVKSSSNAKVDKTLSEDNTNYDYVITFSNGAVYNYSYKDRGIYRNNIKIANNVTGFSAKTKILSFSLNNNESNSEYSTNSIQKTVISLNIIIGKSTNNMFSKKIDYTLRYW